MADSGAPAGRTGSAGPADTLILLPSMSYSEGLLDAVPYVRYFGERSLCDLPALRDPRMRVVLVTAEQIDPWIIDNVLVELSDADDHLKRDMCRRLTCVVPQAGGRSPLADAVLADPHAMQQLHDAVRHAGSAVLVNFAASAMTDELARRLGVPAEEGPADLADRWGTKAGSKALFHESGVPCARGGLDVVTSVAAAQEAAQRLARADPPPERVMVKLNASDWGDGLGNAVVRCSRLLETGDLQRSVETLLQPWDTYCRELQDGGAIVEEYVDAATCWPSAQGRVDGDGVLHLLAIHEQILVAGEYRGCAFPVRPDLAHPLADAMARIGATLVGHGVRGSFGVDFIAANGRIYATEVNLRKVGPSHVIATLHALFAQREGAPGNGGIIGLPVAYVHRRLYRPEVLKTLTPQSALTALRRNGLAYDPATRTGALLHIMGGLADAGYVETTTLATSMPFATALDEQVEAALCAAAREHAREPLRPGLGAGS